MLTPYEYHPVVVSLNEDELDEYISITKKIFGKTDENGKRSFSEYEKMLLIKRARIIAGAWQKYLSLKNKYSHIEMIVTCWYIVSYHHK